MRTFYSKRQSKMKNLTLIQDTDKSVIVTKLLDLAPKGAHFTNGTYAYPKELVVPTTLAGFKRVTNTSPDLPLVIAVNSDNSMIDLEKSDFEPAVKRAEKAAIPLAKLFPNNRIVVIFYDEKTPESLYTTLSKYNLTRTLHKWGYGTTPKEPKIEGAECFELTYAFPLPNNKKPVCYGQTKAQDKPQKTIVDDLRNTFINKDNQLLFSLPHSLHEYQYIEEKNPRQACFSSCTIL
jgi:hypothetical protein